MPRFRSKPKIITAVQIREDNRDEWPTTVHATETNELFVVNGLHSSQINLKFGDYVRIDDDNDNYPIDAVYMAANYEEITNANQKDQ